MGRIIPTVTLLSSASAGAPASVAESAAPSIQDLVIVVPPVIQTEASFRRT